jgi:hypothetical protein
MVAPGRNAMTSVKRFNWIREPTTWQRVQKWRTNHAKVSQQAMDYGTAASNKFASAQVDLTTGMATISAKVANQRIQSQAAASRNQLGSVADLLNTLA